MSYTGKVSKITGYIHYFDIKREQGDYKKVFKETRRIKLLDDDIGKSVLLYKEIVNLGRKALKLFLTTLFKFSESKYSFCKALNHPLTFHCRNLFCHPR